ncbi:paraquat-inducible protein A [Mangrovicoccus sp. HB161399]|uniref:paraquat-inducible protein A n=1 Tax=Mangrovicoccus sp. HB161399 TaxID=2720392 RepID=UPI001557A547|nr:paraquat-inducible protein A [Mangrovicoccus sp. HB161399]
MSRLARWLNLALLIAFPVAWAAPLLRAGLLPFFGLGEISILSGIASLWQTDRALAALVALFALVAPYAKILASEAMARGWLTRRAKPVVAVMARLAMADIFLIALYVVVAKGTGIGHVETAWGLWLFAACVLTSLALSWRRA